MIKDMVSTYSMAELLPPSETITLRTNSTRSFAEWLGKQEIETQAMSVELALHQPVGTDLEAVPIQQLMKHLTEADAEFPDEPVQVSMCLRACLIAALDEVINTATTASAQKLAALCIAGYSRFSLPREPRVISIPIGALYHSAVKQLERSGLTLRGVSFTKEPSKPPTLQNLAEEVDVLWWVENSFSVATQSPYTDLDESEIPFWLAHDLACIVNAPATQSIRNLLARQSNRIAPSSHTWREISQAVTSRLTESDCTPFDLPDIVSSHIRLFPALATTIGGIGLEDMHLSLDLAQTGPEWAIHVFNEILATKILTEETPS